MGFSPTNIHIKPAGCAFQETETETSAIQNKPKLVVSKIKPSVFLSTKENVRMCSKDDSYTLLGGEALCERQS